MQLVLAIVHSDDAPGLIESLTKRQFRATRINTAGGFLKESNATVLLGVENPQVDEVLSVIQNNCQTRTQYINPLIPQGDGTLVRRYPGFGIITMTLQDGDSTYHSWQNTLKRRMGSSTFQLVYTVSKTLTNGNESARFFTNLFPAPWANTRLAKGPANFDRPQRLAFTFVQDLPNKASSRLGKALLNNWSINGFFIAQSGFPLTVINTTSGQGLGGTTANDNVGNWGVKALNNRNYVVSSYYCNNGPVTNAGAVTWGNGTTGVTGLSLFTSTINSSVMS